MEAEALVSPDVTYTNNKYPHVKGEWKLLQTIVGREASIGANSVVIPGVTIGTNAVIRAGPIVTSNLPDGQTVCGNHHRLLTR